MTAAADVGAQRRTLWDSGFRPVPVFNFDARVNSPGKQPKGFAWQADAMRDPPLSVVRQPDVDALNTGVMANGLRAIDLDIEDADICSELTTLATDMFGRAPMRWRNNSGRRLLVYRAAQGEPGKRSIKGERGTVEVLGRGQQFVAYGKHPSGADLLWSGELTDCVADDLPAVAEDDLTTFLAKASEILGSADHARAVVPLELGTYTVHSETGLNEIADLIRHVNPDAPYGTWIQALMAVHAATGGSGAGLSIADEWSSRGSKYKRGEVEQKWRSFRSAGINGGTLAALAREHGADLAAIRIAHMPEDPKWAEEVRHGREVMRNMTVARRDTVSDAPFAVQRDGSIVDQKTGEIILDAEPVSVREEAQDEESSEWVHTTGLIGEIADWIVETARRPNRPLAVGAAIAIIGTMCGRHLATPTGCGTHLFIGCIGASTIGKDRPLKAISQILTAAGFPQLAATGKFKSDSAIETMLSKSPCCCAVVDEMGTNLLAKSSHARASTHEQGITGVLRELWSTSFDTWHGSARALENAKVIEAPAMSIYGASTIDEFYASLGKGVVQNGFLNRFTIIKAAPRAEPRDVDVDAMRTVPDSIVQGLLNLLPREEPGAARHGVPLNTGAHVFDPYRAPPVRTVKYASDEVGVAYTAFDNSILARMDRYPETQPFLGRTAEMSIRLATIHAVSKLGLHAEVRMEDLEWGQAVANASARAMIGDVADRIIESDYQGRFKRVEAIIRERVSLKRSELTMRLNGFMTMRELTDILKNMEEAGMITQEELKTTGRPAVVIRLVE